MSNQDVLALIEKSDDPIDNLFRLSMLLVDHSTNEVITGKTREQLIEAARRLFWEQGYTATGIAEILETAGDEGDVQVDGIAGGKGTERIMIIMASQSQLL